MSAPTLHSALQRWLHFEASEAESGITGTAEAAETALAEAFGSLPLLAPRTGFAWRVAALAFAPAAPLAPAVRPLRRFGWWSRVAVAASLLLSSTVWLTVRAWAPVVGNWLRPGELIDAAAFAVRESAFIFVRGLSAWQVFAQVSDVLLRVLTTPDAAAATAAVALAALGAFHALRGVLASERSVYRA